MNAMAQKITNPVYRDHMHAIRCALSVSAGAMGHAIAKWQTEYQAGWRTSCAGPDLSKTERFTQDCMTRHLLHSALSQSQWAVLVVRFAPSLTHQERLVADRSELDEMSAALDDLMAQLEHPITPDFTGWCLLRWARRMPPGRGAWAEWEGRTDQSLRTLHRRCADTYYALNAFENAAKTDASGLLRTAELIA